MNIFYWYRRLVRSLNRTDGAPTYNIMNVVELPDKIADRTFYVIGNEVWAAAFTCPCGCGATIELSLLKQDRPSWRVRIDWRRMPTVYPSIWRTLGCKSHFFLRHGNIYWVRSAHANNQGL